MRVEIGNCGYDVTSLRGELTLNGNRVHVLCDSDERTITVQEDLSPMESFVAGIAAANEAWRHQTRNSLKLPSVNEGESPSEW
jgi:hypothetical protein